eukprot:CAMPEP_0168454542 /NCGR_PEP_ID=MMETSP0228-20121227/50273_1 /TAXON_ID=133427 /ORGANISM="Protoceratium reticulatum, Strain CCCM 535 (=CCMP 1889)" /LENGTH=224 /DNA_ID=CAMNT_0008469329 /DNA_START=43 /DNA_END=714 /DNA_ORIENTATION=-
MCSPANRLVIGNTAVELEVVDEDKLHGCTDVTGFYIWQPAMVAACRALLLDESLVRSRLVLEFGCGLGGLGIFCAKSGAASVILTDHEPAVLRLAARNASLNRVGSRCDFVAADFARGRSPWRPGVADLAVASDVLFLDRLAPALLGALEALAGEQGGTAGDHGSRGAPCSLSAVVGHEVRRAVYRGLDGVAVLEQDDSVLEEFMRRAGPHARRTTEAGAGKEV